MGFPFRPENFEAILEHYDRNGYAVLTEIDQRVGTALRAVITKITGLSADEIRAASRSDKEIEFSAEVRNELARPAVTPELQELFVSVFGDFLVRLLGPIVHISRDFHPQIKRGAEGYILTGYSGDGREVEAAYGFHTDFTAGRVMTSPSAVVFWTPLNTCEDNGLRLYKASHSKGLLTNRWLPPGTRGVERLGEFVDITAEEGQILIFNFMLLHGTTLSGPRTRISADYRFFPFCGILDSSPRLLRPEPIHWARSRIREAKGETLAAPLYETLAYLGQPIEWPPLRSHSVLHWARTVELVLSDGAEAARTTVAAFANPEEGFDPLEPYLERFTKLPFATRPYATALPWLSAEERRRSERALSRVGVSIAA